MLFPSYLPYMLLEIIGLLQGKGTEERRKTCSQKHSTTTETSCPSEQQNTQENSTRPLPPIQDTVLVHSQGDAHPRE